LKSIFLSTFGDSSLSRISDVNSEPQNIDILRR